MANSEEKPAKTAPAEKQTSMRAEIFQPPSTLISKVSDQGMTQSEKLARAEDTVRLLAEDYPNWALEDLAKLDALFTRIEAESTDDDGNDGGGPVKTSLRAAYRVSHDMRGQGGSFGYPLMTRIATSLCRFIDALEIPNETARAILVAHARAMRAILENRISGEGGTLGSQIAEGLEQAAARHATSNADGG